MFKRRNLALVTVFAAAAFADETQSACPEGTVEWDRAADLSFCAYLCSSDADCDQGMERCRLLDPEAGPGDPPIFIDDNPEIVEVFIADGKATEGLCDPFFDTEGVVGADPVPLLRQMGVVGSSKEVALPPLPAQPKKTAPPVQKKKAPILESDGEGEGP